MDKQDPPTDPAISFTRGLIGLDNEKDAMMLRHAIWRVHSTGPAWLVETQDIFF